MPIWRPSTEESVTRFITSTSTKSGEVGYHTIYVKDTVIVDISTETTTSVDCDVADFAFDGLDNAIINDIPEVIDTPQVDNKTRLKVEGKKRWHTKAVQDWLPYHSAYLDELIIQDGFPHNDKCHSCSDIDAPYCCTECFGALSSCLTCLLSSHKHLPLHRIEKWTRSFWGKTSLQSLGLKIHMGHAGNLCPHPLHEQYLVVYHINGFHLIDVVYCGCRRLSTCWSKYNQLMHVQWYPATTISPHTMFTFAVLNHFHKISVQGKTSAHNYYQGLTHMSDSSGVRHLLKRYDEFLQVTCCYCHLVMAKRAGRAHNPDGINNTQRGQLTLECPSCPHLGKNLPIEWEKLATQWIYMLTLAIDANFRLKSKDRGIDGDSALGPSWAYLMDPVPYYEQLGIQWDKEIHKIETSTCDSTFQAMEKATTWVRDGYLVTRVGAVICTHSGIIRSNGVGDLQKGERYINMDYIFLSVIVGTYTMLLLVTYDIACQWHKNLPRCVRKYPIKLQAAFFNMVLHIAVPKFHLKAHGEACQSRYSLNLLPHSARMDGKGIECGWSHINPITMSTREMGPGFRHNTINDHWSAWNWRKIANTSTLLLKKLVDAKNMLVKHKLQFAQISAPLSVSMIAGWNQMVMTWQKDPLHAPDLYAEPVTYVSLAVLHKALAKEEESTVTEGQDIFDGLTLSKFLLKGLELEEQIHSFALLVAVKKARPYSVGSAVLQERRTTLISRINKWRSAQLFYMPCTAVQILHAAANRPSTGPGQTPTKASEERNKLINIPPLCLLSALTDDLKSALPSQYKLVEKETCIRLAQAEDSLAKLCHLLRLKSSSLDFKRVNNIGQNVQKSQWNYTGSWIWHQMWEGEGKDKEIITGTQVQWAQEQPHVERWQEEITLVLEEMQRTLAYIEWKACWWRTQSTGQADILEEVAAGLHAYAEKQAYKTVILYGHTAEWPDRYCIVGENLPNWPDTKRKRMTLEMARLPRSSKDTSSGKNKDLVMLPEEDIVNDINGEPGALPEKDVLNNEEQNLVMLSEEDFTHIIDGGETLIIEGSEDDDREVSDLGSDIEDI
ncbi:hypothetical protein M0805_001747 [Coniferiporia weirii]|nr:hypothetical protein M0805_001747 [Coniferiporia weirii]